MAHPAALRKPPLRLVRVPSSEASLDLASIYRAHCRYVAAVALRISGHRSELDDTIQDVFAEAARGLEGLRDSDAIRAWLATITVRVVRRRLRRERLYRWLIPAQDRDYEAIADPSASAHDRLLIARVYEVLSRMPVNDRVAFALHHIEGETIDTVAALCECSRTTAKRRVFRARTELEWRLGHD
ncbi:MAG TPA: sigma-70 family RNA polymerase sigma factor [Polyangiaceae bacterium]|jgi:RNA polymerase sigma-70 factor (ECF subfamily)